MVNTIFNVSYPKEKPWHTDSHTYAHFIDIDLTLHSHIRQSRFRWLFFLKKKTLLHVQISTHPFYIFHSQHPTQLMRMFGFHLWMTPTQGCHLHLLGTLKILNQPRLFSLYKSCLVSHKVAFVFVTVEMWCETKAYVNWQYYEKYLMSDRWFMVISDQQTSKGCRQTQHSVHQ